MNFLAVKYSRIKAYFGCGQVPSLGVSGQTSTRPSSHLMMTKPLCVGLSDPHLEEEVSKQK